MLTATRGFNHGPKNTRVETGDAVAEDSISPDELKNLIAMGALEPAQPAVPAAPVPRKPKDVTV